MASSTRLKTIRIYTVFAFLLILLVSSLDTTPSTAKNEGNIQRAINLVVSYGARGTSGWKLVSQLSDIPGASAGARRLKPAADMQNRFKPVRQLVPICI